jgi:hypothetical protein
MVYFIQVFGQLSSRILILLLLMLDIGIVRNMSSFIPK